MILTLITGNFALSSLGLILVNAIASVTNQQAWTRLRLSQTALAVSILGLVATMCWSQENIACLAVKSAVVLNRPWQDVFFHTANIIVLAQSHGGNSLHSPFLSDAPLLPYHYGSYMLACLIVLMAKTKALSVASGFFIPFGFFLTILAAYSFGAQLFSQESGLWAAMAVSLIPDPASMHLVTSFLGYYFFQEGGGVNGTYGVTCFALAWISLFSAYKANRLNNLLWAAGFFAILPLFKLQISLVYAGIFCSFYIHCLIKTPKYRLTFLGTFWLLYLLSITLSQKIIGFPTLRFSRQGAPLMVPMLGGFDCFNPLITQANLSPHYYSKVLIGVPIYTIATYGLWLPLCLLALVMALRKNQPKRYLVFLTLTIINNWIVAFALAPNKGFGDLFEIIHKTFVWPVYIVAVCSACLICSTIATKANLSLLTKKRRAIAYAVLLLLILNTASAGKTLLRSLSGGTGIEFPRGLYDCALFLRANAAPESIVQLCGNDKYQFLMTCSEHFPYVSKLIVNPLPANKDVEAQLNQLSMLPLGSFAKAKLFAQQHHIDWLLVNRRAFSAETFQGTEKPLFSAQDYEVYKTDI
jgi:hypothetical protein